MIDTLYATLSLFLSRFLPLQVADIERFPPPDFESGHTLPLTTTPNPRAEFFEVLDIVILLCALSLSSYLALKRRSRRPIFLLMLFSLVYFGFWREGCVCPIGAIQNIALALFDPGFAVPFTVAAFFLLPLVFTLFFGRSFCAAVCPLGAIQDVALIRPVRVPGWLQHGLGLLAYVYLGAAVLFAATGSAFIICEYDPFVAFFRMTGSLDMLILGACFLVFGLFVGRPYCRFLCPYGALLRLFSRVSRWRITVTPSECVQCRLCEDSCPFGAIEPATADPPRPPQAADRRRLAWLLVLLPVLVVLAGFLVSRMSGPFSRMHATVRLAERIHGEDGGTVEGTIDASDAFRATGRPVEELNAEALAIRGRFVTGGWILGAFLGFLFAMKLINLSIFRRRTDYEADRATCIACGRCFPYCPVEHERRKGALVREGG
jgi:ferredoxin